MSGYRFEMKPGPWRLTDRPEIKCGTASLAGYVAMPPSVQPLIDEGVALGDIAGRLLADEIRASEFGAWSLVVPR
jgi:hypothetical protein